MSLGVRTKDYCTHGEGRYPLISRSFTRPGGTSVSDFFTKLCGLRSFQRRPHVGRAIRPIEASKDAVCYVRFTSILLKNSNFRGDHNSEDRWQPRWKFPWGLSGATDFSAYDPLLALAVASTRGDNAFRAEVGFSRRLNFRLFQQYPSTPDCRWLIEPCPLPRISLVRLVLAGTDVNGVPQKAVGRPGQVSGLGHKLRLDPCTRERTSGEPNRSLTRRWDARRRLRAA